MTAVAIQHEGPSGAPTSTLIELAREAFGAAEMKRTNALVAELRLGMRERLAAALSVSVPFGAIEIEDLVKTSADYVVVGHVAKTSIDGMTFRYYDNRLVFVRSCPKCEQEHEASIFSLEDLGHALAQGDMAHVACGYDCTAPARVPLSTRAEQAVVELEAAGKALAEALKVEQLLEDGRPVVKSAAIRRLMGVENPETGKLHSASSAEKVVESDEAYFSYRVTQANAVVDRIEKQAAYDAAKLRTELLVNLVRTGHEG